MTIPLLLFILTVAAAGTSCAQDIRLPLKLDADIPLTGRATRLDYVSFDPASGRLYIAHLGDGMLTVVDTRSQKVVGDVHDLKNVHGALAVPELHRIYATATGSNELAVIDDQSLEVLARLPTGKYPDGIAYAVAEKKVYVSNKLGHSDTVIDAAKNKVVGTIELDAEAGNTQYDAALDRIYVAVGGANQLVAIDPLADKIVGRYDLAGCKGAHGLLIDDDRALAFTACEDNAKLIAFDLKAKKSLALYDVGSDPDVLAFDTKLRRLYIAAESGVVTVLDEKENGELATAGKAFFAPRAHTVAVDGSTGHVFFPLENINGKPVLRIVEAPQK
jgi:YVTN family beta-propeller protein